MKKIIEKIFKNTYLGFPIKKEKSEVSPLYSSRSRGIALLIAIVCISVMTIFSTDFILNSQMSLETSVSQRDSIKAEYLAKSGINLSIFLITTDLTIDLFMKQSGIGEPTDSLSDVWSITNGFPIGGGSADIIETMQESFDLSLIQDEKIMDTLKLFDGEFASTVEDEQARINVNFLAEGLGTEVRTLMTGLMEGCPADKAFLQDEDVTADKLIARIKDWVDPDKNADPKSGLNDESSVYKKNDPPYVPLNAQFDTLDQLKLIYQWNDDIHTVYSPYLTVYPYQKTGFETMKLNINTTSKELMGCLFPKSKSDCKANYEALYKDMSENMTPVASSKNQIGGALASSFCNSGEAGIDEKMFTVRSDTFRITTTAYVGEYRRDIQAVIQRRVPDSTNKIATSYEILYWK